MFVPPKWQGQCLLLSLLAPLKRIRPQVWGIHMVVHEQQSRSRRAGQRSVGGTNMLLAVEPIDSIHNFA